VSRTALGPTQPPIEWVPGALALRVKRSGSETDHSRTSVPSLRMHGAVSPQLQYVFLASCLVKHGITFPLLWLWYTNILRSCTLQDVHSEASLVTRCWRKLKTYGKETYDGVSKSFRTSRLDRELQMVQLSATRCSCRYFMNQSSEFCRHKPSCCFSTSVYSCCCLFRYRLSPETFGYTLVSWFFFLFFLFLFFFIQVLQPNAG
jgi:hypothetical protein